MIVLTTKNFSLQSVFEKFHLRSTVVCLPFYIFFFSFSNSLNSFSLQCMSLHMRFFFWVCVCVVFARARFSIWFVKQLCSIQLEL